jgi:hypothetical protein
MRSIENSAVYYEIYIIERERERERERSMR